MDRNIEHEFTHEAVCPWCGWVVSDTWEFFRCEDRHEETETECEECEKPFIIAQHVSVDYSTRKLDEPK